VPIFCGLLDFNLPRLSRPDIHRVAQTGHPHAMLAGKLEYPPQFLQSTSTIQSQLVYEIAYTLGQAKAY
jgi:hypothetical protein